jgi:hypothetical protein
LDPRCFPVLSHTPNPIWVMLQLELEAKKAQDAIRVARRKAAFEAAARDEDEQHANNTTVRPLRAVADDDDDEVTAPSLSVCRVHAPTLQTHQQAIVRPRRLRVAEQGYLAPLDHGAGSYCRSLYALR